MTTVGSPSAAPTNGTATHTQENGAHSVNVHHDSSYEALYFLFICLVLGAGARGAVRGSRLPYTVALLFLGLGLGFMHAYVDLGVLGNSLDLWVDIGPHTMLSCFLPALVFESAFSLEWHTFRRCAAQVLWLAAPGVIAGTAIQGSLLKATLPYGWGWASCLMLGSILSATDPVAVVALLKEVGASKRLGHIIEGESLVNDGTAIVVFSLLNEIAKGADKTALEIFSFFVWVPVGAVLVGLGIAAGCHAWLGLGAVAGDHLVQISVTLFACYLCFLVAEFQAAASGVLAVVILGVAIGAFGRGFFTGETEHSLHHFWEMLTFAANTVLFILTGVIIAETTTENTAQGTMNASDFGYGLIVYIEVLFTRMLVISMLYPILRRCGYGLTVADATVCWWGGLRGAVGLALALVVSEESVAYSDEKVGPATLVCVGVVVVLTLAVNGTTTAWLLQLLGLTRPEVDVQVAVRKARRHIRDQCLAVYHEHLTADDVMGTASYRAVVELVPFLEAVPEEDEIINQEQNSANAAAKGGGLAKRTTGEIPGSAVGTDAHGLMETGSPISSRGVSADSLHELAVEAPQAKNVGGMRRTKNLMTPAASVVDLTALENMVDESDRDHALEAGPHSAKNALGQFGQAPDLAAAVMVAVKKDFEEEVAKWQKDVRGRFLAHLKVLYWEALEVGRATKEIVETLVECTDTALDSLDAPLGDWQALERRMLSRAQSARSCWKQGLHALPRRLQRGVRWTQRWVLHTGAHPGGGARRRALVAAALFHDAHQEACHAIFGHVKHGDADAGAPSKGDRDLDGGGVKVLSGAPHAAALDYDAETFEGPAAAAAASVKAEADAERAAAASYLRVARTNEPELAAAVKSEETARRLLAVAERSAKGYVQSGLLTAVEADELLAGINRAQRRLRLDPPEPQYREPVEMMRMMPLLDPTSGSRVHPPSLAARLVGMADEIVLRRYPGDDIAAAVPQGALLVLARGLVEVSWSRPFGEGTGSSVPLRVGASSTSYGWALGAADLLVPGAARFDMRAVSAVSAFVIPAPVVQQILNSPGSAAALWRAAFGLLAATVLRKDLSTVPPQILRHAATKSRVTMHQRGDAIDSFVLQSRQDPGNHPPKELVVLMKGEVHCEGEGTLEAPCVIVPGHTQALSEALSGDQAEIMSKLAARIENLATARSFQSPKKRSEGSTIGGAAGEYGGSADVSGDASELLVLETAVVLRCPLPGLTNVESQGEKLLSQRSGDYAQDRDALHPGGITRRMSINVASFMSRSRANNGRQEEDVGGGGNGNSWGAGDPPLTRTLSPMPLEEVPAHATTEGSELWPHSMDRTTRHLLLRDMSLDAASRTGRMSLDMHSRAVLAEAAALAGSHYATTRAGDHRQNTARPTVDSLSFVGLFGGSPPVQTMPSHEQVLARTLSDGSGHTHPPRLRGGGGAIPEHSAVTLPDGKV